MRRVARTLLVTGLAAVPVGALGGPAHGADSAITASLGRVITADYGPIPGNNAEFQAGVYPDATTCDPGVGCVVVPIRFPNPPKTYDTVVRVAVEWAATPILNGTTSSNDMDIYFWHDPETAAETNPDAAAFPGDPTAKHPAVFSNGTADPEAVAYPNPTVNMNLVVNNSQGVNQGFTVSVFWQSGAYTTPFESLENGTFPVDTSGGPAATSTVEPSPLPAFGPPISGINPLVLPPTPGQVDQDLSFGTLANVDQQINQGPSLFNGPQVKTTRPGPARGFEIFLTMVVLPLLLLLLGTALVMRRRPTALTFA